MWKLLLTAIMVMTLNAKYAVKKESSIFRTCQCNGRTRAARITPIPVDWSERFVEAYNVEIQAWINAVKGDTVEGPSSWDGYVGAITASAASAARDSQKSVNIDMEVMSGIL